MRTVSLNTDAKRGAGARMAGNLHTALRARGIDDELVVLRDADGNAGALRQLQAGARERVDGLPQSLYRPARVGTFSSAWLPNASTTLKLRGTDLVHLHAIDEGLISIEQVGHLSMPVVWTLHDMWPLTGGCHEVGSCEHYLQQCGRCPVLGSAQRWDLSTLTFERKRRALRGVNLTFVVPSHYMRELAEPAPLFQGARIEHIPYGIDLQHFRPQPRVDACAMLGMHPSTRRILCGSSDPGGEGLRDFDLLLRALGRTKTRGWELATFGCDTSPACRYPVRTLGRFDNDEALAAAYGSCDVFVWPARSAHLPIPLIEALACGIPCVAFDVGGIGDIIDHQVNGYLAKPEDSRDLAAGLDWVLSDARRWQQLSEAARIKARRCFDLDDVAEAYQNLFCSLTGLADRSSGPPQQERAGSRISAMRLR